MSAKKLDYIILCDFADEESAGFIEDWLDANLKTAHVIPYDSGEHMQFAVQVSQAVKKAKAVILCLTENFAPFQFPAPQFHAPLQHDPECNKGLVFSVALAPLQETEIKPIIAIIDAFSGDERERRRRFIERITATVVPEKKRLPKRASARAGTTSPKISTKPGTCLPPGGTSSRRRSTSSAPTLLRTKATSRLNKPAESRSSWMSLSKWMMLPEKIKGGAICDGGDC